MFGVVVDFGLSFIFIVLRSVLILGCFLFFLFFNLVLSFYVEEGGKKLCVGI